MGNEDSAGLKRRIRKLGGSSPVAGKCVLYIMSRDQRVTDNHALLAAQKHALAKRLPLAAAFCLYEKSGFRAREHYAFMLAGLREVEQELQILNIPFMLLIGNPRQRLAALLHHVQPDAVYLDFSPLRGPRALAQHLAQLPNAPAIYIVDTHNVIPIWELSDKKELAAYTIRPKVHRLLEPFLKEPDQPVRHPHAWPGIVRSIDELSEAVSAVLAGIEQNNSTITFQSGSSAARERLETFISERLADYAQKRNDPSQSFVSDLSPYLHFGQISSLRIALTLRALLLERGDELHLIHSPKMPQPGGAPSVADGVDALLEEMIVRKELSDNFCYYEPQYDSLESGPQWALQSLREHEDDPREFLYTFEQLAQAKTHDPAWNASQLQLTKTGKMHGYMRMYWAKKVLEWTESPARAIAFLVKMNDFYSLDGGDPNGYVGIVWSVAGAHDRPWTERSVFGKVRYMNYGGLKRKFDIEAYERKWT